MSKKRSKDRKHNGNAKWIRPKGYYCRYEREKGKKAKEFTPEPKPFSPYSATSTNHGLRPGNA